MNVIVSSETACSRMGRSRRANGRRLARIFGFAFAIAAAVSLMCGAVAYADEPADLGITEGEAVICTDYASLKEAMEDPNVESVILRGPIDEVIPIHREFGGWDHAIGVSGSKELTLEGTSVFAGAEEESDADYLAYASLFYVPPSASLVIDGDGELLWLSSGYAGGYNAVIHNLGSVTVLGGKLGGGNIRESGNCRAISHYGKSLIISGGSFAGSATEGYPEAALYVSKGTTQINGGYFKCAKVGAPDDDPKYVGIRIEPAEGYFESAVLRGGTFYGMSLLPTSCTAGDYVEYTCYLYDEEGNDIPLDTPSNQLANYPYVEIHSLKAIDMVSFVGQEPAPGESPHFLVQSADPAQYDVVPDSVDWYDVTASRWMRSGDVFELGHTYRLDMWIEADEDYVFARNEDGLTGVLAAYNGSEAVCCDFTDGTDNRRRLILNWEITLEAPEVYSVSGRVTSQGDESDPIVMHLIPEGYTEVAYELIVTGNDVQYCFADVAEGSYVLRVSKPGHFTGEYDVIVDGESVVRDCELVPIGQPEPVIPYSDLWKSFPDVKKEVEKAGGPEKVWYVADGWLDYVVYAGLMSGYSSNGWFGPYDNITRGQVAVILYRAACALSPGLYEIFGSTTDPEQYAKTCVFEDMEAGVYYTAAVNWAKDAGILTGDSSTGYKTVRPNDPVSRQELCVMLDRYVNGSTSSGELDPGVGEDIVGMGEVADWARGSVNWCVNHGIIYGVDNHDGTYSMDPTGKTWRSAAAKMFTVVMRDIVGL